MNSKKCKKFRKHAREVSERLGQPTAMKAIYRLLKETEKGNENYLARLKASSNQPTKCAKDVEEET